MRFTLISIFAATWICQLVMGQQVIVLNDGRYFEGETLRRTKGGLVFRTKVANLDADLELKTSEIASIKDLAKLPGPVFGQVVALQQRTADRTVSIRLSLDLSRLAPVRFVEVQNASGQAIYTDVDVASSMVVPVALSVTTDGKPFGDGFESDSDSQAVVRKCIETTRIFVSSDGKNVKQYQLRQGTVGGFVFEAVSACERLVLMQAVPAVEIPLTPQQEGVIAKVLAQRAEEKRRLEQLEEKRRKDEAEARARRAEEQKLAAEAEARRREEEAREKAEAAWRAEQARQVRIAERKRLLATGNDQDIAQSFKMLYESVERAWLDESFQSLMVTSYDVVKTASIVSPYEGKIEGDFYGDKIKCHWVLRFKIENGDWVAGNLECCQGGIADVEIKLRRYLNRADCK